MARWRHLLRIILLLVLLPGGASCSRGSAAVAAPVELGGAIFASRWRVVLASPLEDEVRVRVRIEVEAALHAVEAGLSAWKRDSEIVRCHKVAAGAACPVSAYTAAVVRTSLDATRATGGAFDVTVGPLLDVWGLSASTRGRVRDRPDPSAIAEALRRVDASAIEVRDAPRPALVRARDDVRLDVTAVTDGAAALAVARVLLAHGLRHFLVDVAGEVVVAGNAEGRPGGRAWRVGISDTGAHATERPGESDVAALTVMVEGDGLRAVSTSGITRDTHEVGGATVSHIVDPRTGTPVVTDLVSCTVIGDDAVLVDALSTACIVLGRDAMEATLARLPGPRRASALYGFAGGRFEPGVGFAGTGVDGAVGSNRTHGSVVPD